MTSTKAEHAISALERIIANPSVLVMRSSDFCLLPYWQAQEDKAMADACHAEVVRLKRAIAEPWRLWAIYRRADKTLPYAVKPESAEPQSVPAAVAELVAA
jgi:hypothetical protein